MKINNAIQFAYQDVVGTVYHNKGNRTAIIHCKGGPSFGDDGRNETYSRVSSELGCSVVVPDYLGSGRSGGGDFSIQSSVKTLSIVEDMLSNNCSITDCWKNSSFKLNVNNIVLKGHSWGGSVASLYYHFYPDSRIKNVVLSAGVLDYDPKKHTHFGGESDKEFWQQVITGWKHYYRNIEHSNWKPLVLSKDKSLNPLKNTSDLAGRNVLVIHGKYDDVISWKRSKEYYEVFTKENPDSNIAFKTFSRDHQNIRNMHVYKYILKHFNM